jgi:hypothetical protein
MQNIFRVHVHGNTLKYLEQCFQRRKGALAYSLNMSRDRLSSAYEPLTTVTALSQHYILLYEYEISIDKQNACRRCCGCQTHMRGRPQFCTRSLFVVTTILYLEDCIDAFTERSII